MSKIEKAFKEGKAFIPFITAGDPCLEKTGEFILAMEEAGADLIEIGIPFSDPIAEGPVIQEADLRALAAGTTTDRIFDLVGDLRRQTQVPLVLMTYLNPVFHYGYENFFARCQAVEMDEIIIPDLPFEEKGEMEDSAASHGVDLISMVAPTSEDRIQKIAGEARGFLYVVSSLGVTGMRQQITTDLPALLANIRKTARVPACIGFGIHSPEQAAAAAQVADGVIVGSAIVKIVEKYGENAAPHLAEYVRMMKGSIRSREDSR